MGDNSTLKTINILLKISITILSGVFRILLQIVLAVPKVLSRALTILMKVGVIYKLLIDPILRSIGAFFAGLWRAAMQHRASSKVRKEKPGDMRM
jgi:hypothetical protein